MILAQVIDGQIARAGTAPTGPGWADGAWRDFTNPDALAAWMDEYGWVPLVEEPRPDDTATTTHDAEDVLIEDVPTRRWVQRPKTEDELAAERAEAEQNARLDDHEARLTLLEAVAFPAQPEPAPETPTVGVKTFAEWGGVVPPRQLVLDGGRVWRNVARVPLTTAPSGFVGWTEANLAPLWVPVVGAAPDPEPDPDPEPPAPSRPAGYVGAWSATAEYAVGNVVDRNGRYYRAKVAHGAAYAGTWGPPLASVWDDIGAV